jgi:hypothetical protein
MIGIIQHLKGSVSKGSLSFICSISICKCALQNLLRAMKSTSPHKGFYRVVDFCHAVDSVAHRMLSRSAFRPAVDFCRAVDYVAQWIFPTHGLQVALHKLLV